MKDLGSEPVSQSQDYARGEGQSVCVCVCVCVCVSFGSCRVQLECFEECGGFNCSHCKGAPLSSSDRVRFKLLERSFPSLPIDYISTIGHHKYKGTSSTDMSNCIKLSALKDKH